MNKKLLAAVLAVFLLILGGCGEKAATDSPKEVKVGTWKTAQTIQPFLYKDYLPEGYNIEVLPFTNPGDQKAALLAGSLDMCGTTLATAIIGASRGEPIVIVSSLCNKCSALVVGKDSGIDDITDLKGKTIAYVPGTMHHILLLQTLEKAGLDPQKDVTLKRIDFFDMAQALSQGEIDAFCSGEPYPSIAVTEGYGKILAYPYYDDSIGPINAGMLTTREKIEKEPQLIQDLVTAHLQATQELMQNPDKWLDFAEDFGTDRKVLETALSNMELVYDIDQKYIEQATNLAYQMKELGVISEVPDMQKLFDLSFLTKAKEELNK